MSDTNHSSLRRFLPDNRCLMNCTCNNAEVIVEVAIPEDGTDFEELEQMCYEAAGYDERGACSMCSHERRVEEAGEAARYNHALATDY